jgi:NAD(P)-dependent dehydrogenase (short-subunit alcohol dehydrogenase family)
MQDYSALVTGGAQGIGLAISSTLVTAGMQVLMLDRDAKAGKEAQAALGERAHFLRGDVADEATLRKAVVSAAKLGKGLHAVVSNTGISIVKPPTKLTLKEWNRVLAVNLRHRSSRATVARCS